MIAGRSLMGGDLFAAAATHVGCVRAENEDAVTPLDARPLWAVADGMGGHARGAWAASQVCTSVERTALCGSLDVDCAALADRLAETNAAVHAESARNGTIIGTTVAALLLADGHYACLWAGDSRVYLVRDGRLRQLTRDHSQVEELVAAGLLTPAQARDHPLGNVVTRAVGVSPRLELDVAKGAVRQDDRFLLCSDGLTKVVADAEIVAVLMRQEVEAACGELLQLTLRRGAPDNVSMVAVEVRHPL